MLNPLYAQLVDLRPTVGSPVPRINSIATQLTIMSSLTHTPWSIGYFTGKSLSATVHLSFNLVNTNMKFVKVY